MSLLLPDSGLIFWMILSFGIVLFVLWKFGFPPILKAVQERKTFIDESLKAAQEANARLEKLKEDSDSIIEQAHQEQGRIIKDAMQQRDRIVANAQRQARDTMQQELEKAQQAIQLEKEEAVRDVRRTVAELSVDIAEKVLRRKLDDEPQQMSFIDKMLDDIENRSN